MTAPASLPCNTFPTCPLLHTAPPAQIGPFAAPTQCNQTASAASLISARKLEGNNATNRPSVKITYATNTSALRVGAAGYWPTHTYWTYHWTPLALLTRISWPTSGLCAWTAARRPRELTPVLEEGSAGAPGLAVSDHASATLEMDYRT